MKGEGGVREGKGGRRGEGGGKGKEGSGRVKGVWDSRAWFQTWLC